MTGQQLDFDGMEPAAQAEPKSGELKSTPRGAPSGRNRPRKIVCQWCGEQAIVHSHRAKFCSPKCSKEFNALRLSRGGAFYDIVMAGRFDRANNAGYLTALSQLARMYRDEDVLERAGRPSWGDEGFKVLDR